MVYENEIKGKFVTLRSITLDDVQFSYNLRRDPRFVNIMGQPAATIEDQKKFIEWQMNQQGDYYFVVLNNGGEKIGLIGVYNIHDGIGEIGREINTGAPYESMEAEILLNDFSMNVLNLKIKTYVIYENNSKQFALQHKLGFEPVRKVIRSGIPSYEYEMTFEEGNKHFEKARKLIEQLSKGQKNV